MGFQAQLHRQVVKTSEYCRYPCLSPINRGRSGGTGDLQGGDEGRVAHRAAAHLRLAQSLPVGLPGKGLGLLLRGLPKLLPAPVPQGLGLVPIQAVVTDRVLAGLRDMPQDPAQEMLGGKGQGL